MIYINAPPNVIFRWQGFSVQLLGTVEFVVSNAPAHLFKVFARLVVVSEQMNSFPSDKCKGTPTAEVGVATRFAKASPP